MRRVEDPALLRGEARYVDDLDIEGVVHACFVRSPYAHAEVRDIRTEGAIKMPGVLAVSTAADVEGLAFAGLMQLHPTITRPAIAADRVRFVGDIVAVVIAETLPQAIDAAELVEVDYEALPSVVDVEAALAADAPLQFESLGTNLIAGARAPGTIAPLADADVVVRGRFVNQRLAVAPMEGAAIAAVPGDDDGPFQITVYMSCQMPHMVQRTLAGLLDLDPERVRLVAPHVGGSFGGKHLSVEGLVVAKLALALQRPVKYVETRGENMVASPHGRGQVQYATMGFRRDGTIVGAHFRVIGDAGAYAGFGGALVNLSTRVMAQGVYRIPKLAFDFAVVGTNTTPMGAYRGAGRPEATAMLERIMDLASYELEIDPVQLRRQNLLRPEDFPFSTLTRQTYDSGDYGKALDEAMRIARYDDLRAEQAQRRTRGERLQLGIGVAVYVEITGSGSPSEYSEIEVHDDGTATVKSGCSAHGQGHQTTFSSIAADVLGIPLERIRFVQSDTAQVQQGGGTGGSRSLQLGGSAVRAAAHLVLERARALAADLLEAAPEDIVVVPEEGLGVTGVPAAVVPWAAIAAAAAQDGGGLRCDSEFQQAGPTFPFGAHISVVEVDTETGRVVPLRHIAVDDCGRVLNPLIVGGQVHGGLASGLAQALWEEFVYDDDGNPLTTSLADYAMPSASEFPSFECANTETPSPFNPLGAKGIGESATVGSTPAVQNAVIDALSHLGVRHIDMPCTAERVWRAIVDAEAGTLPSPWKEPPEVFASLAVTDAKTEPEEGVDL